MNDQNRSLPNNPAQGGSRPNKPLELPDCIAHPTGATCPVDWCRKARGNWCKRNGEWCRWRRY